MNGELVIRLLHANQPHCVYRLLKKLTNYLYIGVRYLDTLDV